MTKHPPSKYQRNFYDKLLNTNHNILISAVAGSGKTTTIVDGVDMLPTGDPTIFLAFNRDIVAELKTRINRPNTWIKTLHSFGANMLYSHYGALKMNEDKYFHIALKLFEKYAGGTKEKKQTYAYRVSRLVEMARLTLVDMEDDEAILGMAVRYDIDILENEIEAARMVLEAGIKDADTVIDYADMLYIPYIKNLKLRKFKYVFVDEVQDLNRLQQEIIKRIIYPKGGRLIAVGDPFQSIYGFAGADTASFERMKTLVPNMIQVPLDICYRCSPEIVELAQSIVPHIEYNPAKEKVKAVFEGSYKELQQNDWVLCRNTKPLVLLFIQLVADGRNAFIKGREMGANLVNLIKRTKGTTLDQVISKLNEDRVNLKIKLIKKRVYQPDRSQQMVAFNEKFLVVKILARECTSVKELIARIESIFLDKKQGAITLSTIHKAKGAEADNVYVIAPELMPSKYAKTEEDFEQEAHLKYVCYTRAKKKLVFVNDFNIEQFEKTLAELNL